MVWIIRKPYTGLITAILDIEATDVVKALKELGYEAEKAANGDDWQVGKVLPMFHE